MQKRKNKLNHQYFDNIDSEYKAYILGFIYADGCIVAGKNGRQSSLRIGIQYQDGHILQPLLDGIYGSNIRIPVRKLAPAMIKSGDQPQAIVNISSEEMMEALAKLGCLPNKTVVGIKFPALDKKLNRHFIRGFFDGNGSITVDYTKNKYTRVATYVLKNPFTSKIRKRMCFCSTDKQFLKDILTKCNITLRGKPQWRETIKRLSCFKLSIEQQADIEDFFNYMYKDSSIFLQRKYDKFIKTIKSQAESTDSEGVETT